MSNSVEDAIALLDIVEENNLDLTAHSDAVRHLLSRRPGARQTAEFKILCPSVLGEPWKWNQEAEIYWRAEHDQLRYLDSDFQRHKFNGTRRPKFGTSLLEADPGSTAMSTAILSTGHR